MTKLRDILLERIAQHGPIALDEYMATALTHPEYGYYTTRDPLGTSGDFTTAPEISQMFGELIGLSLAQAWLDQGAPETFALVELGPGRGTLMADILRATLKVSGFAQAAKVHLVETSPKLMAEQATRLPDTTKWHSDTTTLPDLPLFVIANEFFDALPIRQYQRSGRGWRAMQVAGQGKTLKCELAEPQEVPALSHRFEDTEDGDIVETCPALPGIISDLSTRITAYGGATLIIDYGDWRSHGDTLQAVQDHASVDPFASPGQADITAHVDFEAIAHAATPSKFTRVSQQGVFLERLGITARAQNLAAPLSGDALEDLIAAHRRLTDPAEMGSLFKVIGLYPDGAPPPAGLEP